MIKNLLPVESDKTGFKISKLFNDFYYCYKNE